MQIRRIISLMTMVCLCLLAGCSSNALPEGMTEDQVRQASEQVVTMLSDGNYAGIEALYDSTMKSALPAGQLKTALSAQLDQLGGFQSFDQESFYGKKGYAVAVLTCSYESGKAIFTISLNPDYQLSGLYMK